MKVFSLILLGGLLVSCSTLDAVHYLTDSQKPAPAPTTAADNKPEAPTSTQQASASFDAKAKADWTRYSNPGPSSRSFGAGADLSAGPASLAAINVGEWAVYRNIEKGQTKAVIRIAVVGRQDDALIFEFDSLTEKESASIQEAVRGLDNAVKTGDSSQGKLLWIKVKDKDGKIQTIEGAMLAMAGDSYKNMITGNAAHLNGTVVPGGPVSVPAGTFAATWKADSRVAQGRTTQPGTAWVSSLVPVWHLVKGVGNDGQVLELVDFGSSGFQSAFP